MRLSNRDIDLIYKTFTGALLPISDRFVMSRKRELHTSSISNSQPIEEDLVEDLF